MRRGGGVLGALLGCLRSSQRPSSIFFGFLFFAAVNLVAPLQSRAFRGCGVLREGLAREGGLKVSFLHRGPSPRFCRSLSGTPFIGRDEVGAQGVLSGTARGSQGEVGGSLAEGHDAKDAGNSAKSETSTPKRSQRRFGDKLAEEEDDGFEEFVKVEPEAQLPTGHEARRLIVNAYRASFKLHPNDTGGSAVQIAGLTARISQLSKHLVEHRKDFSGMRSLKMLVAQRRRLLQYLARTDHARYELVLRTLNLKPVMMPHSVKLLLREHRYAMFRNTNRDRVRKARLRKIQERKEEFLQREKRRAAAKKKFDEETFVPDDLFQLTEDAGTDAETNTPN